MPQTRRRQFVRFKRTEEICVSERPAGVFTHRGERGHDCVREGLGFVRENRDALDELKSGNLVGTLVIAGIEAHRTKRPGSRTDLGPTTSAAVVRSTSPAADGEGSNDRTMPVRRVYSLP